jgi:hypothetical protein
MIGCNDEEFESFLVEDLASYDPLLRAFGNPSSPAFLASH